MLNEIDFTKCRADSINSDFLLIIAVFEHPRNYDFYILLRWIICVISCLIAYRFLTWEKIKWVYTFGIIAFLFNPVIPIHLSRSEWVVIDFVVIFPFAVSMFFIRWRYHENE